MISFDRAERELIAYDVVFPEADIYAFKKAISGFASTVAYPCMIMVLLSQQSPKLDVEVVGGLTTQ